MLRRSSKFQGIAGLTVAVSLASAGLAFSQFTSLTDHSRALLEGNWQSCRDGDGKYSERIYDGKVTGVGPYELHMGPYHEFALFRGVQDDHREHTSSDNLLRPFTVEVVGNTGKRQWDAAGLRLEVTLAGGSREDCESWWISLRRGTTSSSH